VGYKIEETCVFILHSTDDKVYLHICLNLSPGGCLVFIFSWEYVYLYLDGCVVFLYFKTDKQLKTRKSWWFPYTPHLIGVFFLLPCYVVMNESQNEAVKICQMKRGDLFTFNLSSVEWSNLWSIADHLVYLNKNQLYSIYFVGNYKKYIKNIQYHRNTSFIIHIN
jgi:hypothetical protein